MAWGKETGSSTQPPHASKISQHPSFGGDEVSEHLQTGPGGGYVLQRQTQPQSLSHSHTKILCCEKASLKAWLLFHLNSVANIPLVPTPLFLPILCPKQVFHPDTKHFLPSSPSLPSSVFTPASLWEERKIRLDQTPPVWVQVKQSEIESVCSCVHFCVYILMLLGTQYEHPPAPLQRA